MADAPTRKALSLDEVLDIVSDIARNGEGPERFRALKLIMSQEAGSATLPEPFSDAEIIDRLARLIRAAGPTASQLAYRKAFPSAKRMINQEKPRLTESDLPPIDKATLPSTLRALYREFPEAKRPGVPKGYPVKAGMAVKAAWVRNEALKMRMDQERAKLDLVQMHESAEGSHGE